MDITQELKNMIPKPIAGHPLTTAEMRDIKHAFESAYIQAVVDYPIMKFDKAWESYCLRNSLPIELSNYGKAT